MREITSQHGQLILALSNNNIRQSLVEIRNLLEHSNWFERDGHTAGAFNIQDNEYRATHVGVFRAMILQDSSCFSYQSDSVLVNPFYNFPDPDGDLMGCLVFKYFFQQAKLRKTVLVDELRMKDKLEICFPEQVVEEYFEILMSYFKEEEAIRIESYNGDRRIIPQNKLFAIYKTLSQTSVFLEFFRDATYLHFDSSKKHNIALINGTSRIATVEQFLALYDFVEQIMEAERVILDRVRRGGLLGTYDKNFGHQLISKQVLRGVTKNAHLYFNTGRRVSKLPDSVSRRLADLHTFLRVARLER